MWKLYGNCTHLFDNVYLVDFIVTLVYVRWRVALTAEKLWIDRNWGQGRKVFCK